MTDVSFYDGRSLTSPSGKTQAVDQSCHSHKLRCNDTLLQQPESVERNEGKREAETEERGRDGELKKTYRVREGEKERARERERALRYLVEVPFLTSQMLHLKASAVFLKVHTLQSQ